MAVNSLPQVLTVSELAYLLKASIEESFGSLRLRGEVTGLKRHTSGHLYYRLKDMEAVIDAVSWRGTLGKWISQLEDGMEVICTGRITTYPGGSRYQIIVEEVELAGEGALLKILEQRKKALAAEGLFAEDRKKALPFLPTTLGVITSPTGVVIRDILHRLRERFPCHVLVWPVAVQGENSAQQVAQAIEGFNTLTCDSPIPLPDILIVARGGGALEDLWAFNEEVVVRAIAASRIPVITAIGHETDITLADFAADRRAPTPTAAAEIAVPVRLELIAKRQSLTQRLVISLKNHLDDKNLKLTALSERVPPPSRWLDAKTLRLDDWTERLRIVGASYIQKQQHFLHSCSHRLKHPQEILTDFSHQLNAFDLKLHALFYHRIVIPLESRLTLASKLLENLSYRRVLERGFALVTNAKGRTIASVSQAMAATKLNVHFAEGTLQVSPIKKSHPDAKKSPFAQMKLFEGE